MLSAALQILAFALALLGVLGAAVATLLPNWQVWTGSWSALSRTQGLWMDCVWHGAGVFSCRLKSSPLSLPPYLQATRAAMVLSCLVALFGLCLAALGLRCTRWGGGHRAKGHTAVAAGGCFVLASLLCLGTASWFTNEVIAAFLTADLPDGSRYQPGGALCVTFLSAGFLLAAGVIFCLSCPGKRTGRPETPSGTGRPETPSGTGRPETPANPDRPPTHQEPNARRNRTGKMQVDDVKRENACEGEHEQDQEERVHPPPAKPPQRDLKDSYSFQEYV